MTGSFSIFPWSRAPHPSLRVKLPNWHPFASTPFPGRPRDPSLTRRRRPRLRQPKRRRPPTINLDDLIFGDTFSPPPGAETRRGVGSTVAQSPDPAPQTPDENWVEMTFGASAETMHSQDTIQLPPKERPARSCQRALTPMTASTLPGP